MKLVLLLSEVSRANPEVQSTVEAANLKTLSVIPLKEKLKKRAVKTNTWKAPNFFKLDSRVIKLSSCILSFLFNPKMGSVFVSG